MIKLVSVAMVLAGTLVGSVGALVLKKGVGRYTFLQFLFSRYFIGGTFLYALSTVLYFLALRQEQLSVVYPLVSTAYIWTTILAALYLNEKITRWKIISLAGIIVGIILISVGS